MDAMDEEAVRRLNAVQLEDLGTARREYISTVDTNKKFRNITIDAIEAAREANKKGSAVHRLAEKNKKSLNAWNSAWQSLCDEVDVEDLDPLMGGQTHRAHLSAFVKENGGQNYGQKPIPARPAKVHKPVGVSGRGALASTRGRGGSHARLTIGSPHGRPLDPARDCNNKGSPPRGINKKRGDIQGGARRPPKPPTLRTRRVVGPSVVTTYNNLLADSSEFMSAISNLVPPKPPVLSIADAGQTQSHGNVETTAAPAEPELVEEAPEPNEDEQKNFSGRVITPPVTNFVLYESPASDGGAEISRNGKLNGIGSVPPSVNKQQFGVKKEQEASLLDSSVEPLPGNSAPLVLSSSSTPDPERVELERLIKLLANSTGMPPEAVSYLEGRKQALEKELGKTTGKLQSPCHSKPGVKPEPKVEIKHEHSPKPKLETKAGSDFGSTAKHMVRASIALAQAQAHSASQSKPEVNRPVNTAKKPIDPFKSAGQATSPEFETRSIQEPSKTSTTPKPIVKLPGLTSTPSANHVHEARFSIKTDKPVTPRGIPIVNGRGNIIGDHLLPGRETQPAGAPRNPLFQGVHPRPKTGKVAPKPDTKPAVVHSALARSVPELHTVRPTNIPPVSQRRVPHQGPISAKPKEESAKPTHPLPVMSSGRAPPTLVLENRLPVHESMHPLATENIATRITPKTVEVPCALAQPTVRPKFEAADAPGFPMTAATMQHFRAQTSPTIPPKSPSTDNDGLPKDKGEDPVEAPSARTQPTPAGNFETVNVPAFPMTAATMQYFRGQISQAMPSGVDIDKTVQQRPEAKDVNPVEPVPPTQPAPVAKFEIADTPAFPMTAATMQFFGGQMSKTKPPKAPSAENAKPSETFGARGVGVEPKSDIMMPDEKPRLAAVKEHEASPETTRSASEFPRIPITAATLQYAKYFFKENPQALEPPQESSGNVDQGLSPSPQRSKHALSPSARPFDPTKLSKENADPQTTFMKRMEKQGVSAKKTGVYASRYAN